MKKRSLPTRKKSALSSFLADLENRSDFTYLNIEKEFVVHIGYYNSVTDHEQLQSKFIPYIKHLSFGSVQELHNILPAGDIHLLHDPEKIDELMLKGYVVIYCGESPEECLLFPLPVFKSRQISIPEVEFSVVGPKEAFVESIDTNINLVRKRIPSPQLKFKELQVGDLTQTKVCVAYIEGVTNKENVNTIVQRIEDIEIDHVIDSSYIQQIISDNRNSPFPQLLDTERPDRTSAILSEGKVAVFVDNSPHVLIGPTTLVEFFSAFEDYFLNWTIASIFRLIRLFAVFFSILSTPIYVAVLTHHYEMIPQALLGTLVSSRSQVPFPPILEAIILELTIELLREAGARLPTKVGQTIGIVGGIVIGTASVEAGLTSNVLLIFVALAALASFTTPVYKMGNTIRLIRFPFLLSAHAWGLLGISVSICYIMAHLLRLKSLGRPFLEPIYPFRLRDLKDAFIRLPFSVAKNRPLEVRSNKPPRLNPDEDRDNE